ncbi:MAG: hypothetical protein ACPL4E_04575 [Thermoproteota archaeon]
MANKFPRLENMASEAYTGNLLSETSSARNAEKRFSKTYNSKPRGEEC